LATYYPLEPDFSVREPTAVHDDFQTLTNTFPNQPIHLLEVGYPSGEDNDSSYAKQAAFIHELFLAWDAHAGQIPLINYTWQTEMSPESVEWMTDYYHFDDPGFVSYLATLGLRTFDNADKPSFRQLAAELAKRLTGLFLQGEDGKRPFAAHIPPFRQDPHWGDLLLFHEYFHGDNRTGLGASHQTGWAGLVAGLIRQQA
jgi:hypothetical protein